MMTTEQLREAARLADQRRQAKANRIAAEMEAARVAGEWAWNGNYDDLERVAEWLPEFSVLRAEVVARLGVPYDAEFKGKIPGIAGKREDTAIFLLQRLYRQRKMDARVAAWLADGWQPISAVDGITKFARVIIYRPADGWDEWHEYADARLLPETNPHQAEVTGQIAALLPKGKRSNGVRIAGSYAVLVQS